MTKRALDETDLVFIDPVSTGYSRPVEGEEASQYHEFQKDIEKEHLFLCMDFSILSILTPLEEDWHYCLKKNCTCSL